MTRLAPILALCALPAYADGPLTGSQCDEPFPDLATYAAQFNGAPAEIVAGWHEVGLAAWTDACVPLSARMGWTDEELLAAVLNGHDVPPAQVPVPGAIWMLAAGLAALGWKR